MSVAEPGEQRVRDGIFCEEGLILTENDSLARTPTHQKKGMLTATYVNEYLSINIM